VTAARRTLWIRSGLLALVVLALLGFTLHSLRLSDASFATSSNNKANVFIAGNLGHANNLDGSVLFTLSGMKPGSTSKSMDLILTGTGDLTGDYELSVDILDTTPKTSRIPDVIYLKITDKSGDELCNDPIGDFDPIDLGPIAPKQTNAYSVSVSYPPGATNGAAQSASVTAAVRIAGVSQ
jgi:hypothetical protein